MSPPPLRNTQCLPHLLDLQEMWRALLSMQATCLRACVVRAVQREVQWVCIPERVHLEGNEKAKFQLGSCGIQGSCVE